MIYMNNRENRKTWAMSDPHCGHGNIIKYCNRPFLNDVDKAALEANGGTWHDGSWKGSRSSQHRISQESIDMMDNNLIDNINKYVSKNDRLLILGDFCFPGNQFRRKVKEYRERIKVDCVELILGNHDGCHYRPWLKNKCYCKLPNNDTCYDVYADYFYTVSDYQFIKINGQNFAFFHYACAVWDGSHRNSIMCYAHSHSQAEPWLDRIMPGRRSIDVGVDNAYKIFGEYRPFSIDEIIQLVGNNTGHRTGDHHIDINAPSEEELC